MTVEITPTKKYEPRTPAGLFTESFLRASTQKSADTARIASEMSCGMTASRRVIAVQTMYEYGAGHVLGEDDVAGEVCETILSLWGMKERTTRAAHTSGRSLAAALRSANQNDFIVRAVLVSRGIAQRTALVRAVRMARPFDFAMLAEDVYRINKFHDRSVVREWSRDLA